MNSAIFFHHWVVSLGKKENLLQLVPAINEDQEFLIVHTSRQIIEDGVLLLDNTALVRIGETLNVNGHICIQAYCINHKI